MTGTQWGEWGVVAFSMSVLAWVIFRLTSVLVRLINPSKVYEDDSQCESDG